MINNKKGQEFIVDIFAYFMFMIVVIIFIVLMYAQKLEFDEKVATGLPTDFEKTRLLILLRTPATSGDITIGELFMDAPFSDDKKDILKKELKKNLYYDYKNNWQIKFYLNDKIQAEFGSPNPDKTAHITGIFANDIRGSVVSIPSNNGQIIKVVLVTWSDTFQILIK